MNYKPRKTVTGLNEAGIMELLPMTITSHGNNLCVLTSEPVGKVLGDARLQDIKRGTKRGVIKLLKPCKNDCYQLFSGTKAEMLEIYVSKP